MRRQKNEPNWVAIVDVYASVDGPKIESFEIGQVWDGTRAGHLRLWRACSERLEDLRDKTHFYYILWGPKEIHCLPWVESVPAFMVAD